MISLNSYLQFEIMAVAQQLDRQKCFMTVDQRMCTIYIDGPRSATKPLLAHGNSHNDNVGYTELVCPLAPNDRRSLSRETLDLVKGMILLRCCLILGGPGRWTLRRLKLWLKTTKVITAEKRRIASTGSP